MHYQILPQPASPPSSPPSLNLAPCTNDKRLPSLPRAPELQFGQRRHALAQGPKGRAGAVEEKVISSNNKIAAHTRDHPRCKRVPRKEQDPVLPRVSADRWDRWRRADGSQSPHPGAGKQWGGDRHRRAIGAP